MRAKVDRFEAARPDRPDRPATDAEVRALAERWRDLRARIGRSPGVNQPWRSVGLSDRARIEHQAAELRAARADLTAALWYRGPVDLDDGTTVRLNAAGDGPAFLHPNLFSPPRLIHRQMRALDLVDAVRFAGPAPAPTAGRKAVGR